MKKIVNVDPLPRYQLRLQFSDGVTGTVDLSQYVGQGVFAAWKDASQFSKVTIGPGGELVWNDQIDLCADALYLEVTGKKPEDVFPSLQGAATHA